MSILLCNYQYEYSCVFFQNVYYVIKASMSILHNIARNPTAKTFFKENKTSEVIHSQLNLKQTILTTWEQDVALW